MHLDSSRCYCSYRGDTMSVRLVASVDLIGEGEDGLIGVLGEGHTRDPVADSGRELTTKQPEGHVGAALAFEDWLAGAYVFYNLLGQH